jgi:hypothetical protein
MLDTRCRMIMNKQIISNQKSLLSQYIHNSAQAMFYSHAYMISFVDKLLDVRGVDDIII